MMKEEIKVTGEKVIRRNEFGVTRTITISLGKYAGYAIQRDGLHIIEFPEVHTDAFWEFPLTAEARDEILSRLKKFSKNQAV